VRLFRGWLAALAAIALPVAAVAQGEAQEAAAHGYTITTIDLWKLANLALLLAAAAYFGRHKVAQFFAFRTKEITLGIAEAAKQREAAEAQYAAMEQRLAGIEKEIAALKEEAARESSAEAERVSEETKRDMDKIRAQAEQEIASAGKAARMELQAYTAELAVSLAEARIREQLTPDADRALIESMVGEFVQRSAGQAVRAS
jgi:F-type H+-transporting ATPase subunit b